VLFPAIAEYQNEKERVKQMTRRSIKISSFIMSPLLIGLAVTAKQIIIILLTEKWLPCVPYLQLLCIYYVFVPIHTSNLQAINAVGRSDIFLKLEIIKKFIGIGLFLITIFFFNSVIAIAAGYVVYSVVATFINAAPNKKLLNYGYVEQAKDIVPSLLCSLIMGIAVYCIQFIGFGVTVTLLIQIVLGISVYEGLVSLFKEDSLNYILNIIKNLIIVLLVKYLSETLM
jgi:O-antigen/teichoic acid export membrane protein